MSDKLINMEVETKYKVEGNLVYAFKKLVQDLPDLKEFLYLESDDIYYVKSNEFIRHRFDPKNLKGRQELTYKRKRDTNNNIYRTENNVRCDANSIEGVAAFCQNLGFIKDFTISKFVHIYRFQEVTLPFYTVIDSQNQMSHFIEIEIEEESIHHLTEDNCWDIISKWEKILAPLGITAQKRLRKSLFDMYRTQGK